MYCQIRASRLPLNHSLPRRRVNAARRMVLIVLSTTPHLVGLLKNATVQIILRASSPMLSRPPHNELIRTSRMMYLTMSSISCSRIPRPTTALQVQLTRNDCNPPRARGLKQPLVFSVCFRHWLRETSTLLRPSGPSPWLQLRS